MMGNVTFVVEAVAAHNSLIDAENVTSRNVVGPAFVSQIAYSHVL